MEEQKQYLVGFFESRIETYDSFVNEWENEGNVEMAKKIRSMYEFLLKKLNKEGQYEG